jgi:chaperonin cofactor prefoldin
MVGKHGEAQEENVTLPWRLTDMLTGAHYTVSIIVVLVGIVVWSVRQEGRINEVFASQLAQDKRLEDFDVHGTRALSERVSLLTDHLRSLEKREDDRNTQIEKVAVELNSSMRTINEGASKQIQGVADRLSAWENALRAVDVIRARQDEVFRRLDGIEKTIDRAASMASQLEQLKSRLDDLQQQRRQPDRGPH